MAERHGKYKSQIYKVWTYIKSRCNNPKNKDFKYYGGRGIKVCKEWESSFLDFYQYCLSLPNFEEDKLGTNYSIDRIDNNKGYEPNNIRFVDRQTQNTNRRKYKNNKAGFKGVCFIKRTGKYRAKITSKGNEIYIGYYKTAEKANDERVKYIKKHNLNEYL